MQIQFHAHQQLLHQEFTKEVLHLLYKVHVVVQLIELQQAHHSVLESLQLHQEAIIVERIKHLLVL